MVLYRVAIKKQFTVAAGFTVKNFWGAGNERRTSPCRRRFVFGDAWFEAAAAG
jgi:hypothetical protein